jgi:hypothetical protein
MALQKQDKLPLKKMMVREVCSFIAVRQVQVADNQV